MKTGKWLCIGLFLSVLFLLSACSNTTQPTTATIAPTPTQTPQEKITPVATATSIPTPTATQQSAPTTVPTTPKQVATASAVPTPTAVLVITATPKATPTVTFTSTPTAVPTSQKPVATPVERATPAPASGSLVGGFAVAVSSIKRQEAQTLVSIVLTKTAQEKNVPESIPVSLFDDHDNKYNGKAELFFGTGQLSVLPVGFSFTTDASVTMPKAAPIKLIQIGNANFGQAQIKPEDAKPFQQQLNGTPEKNLVPGAQIRVGKYLVLTPGATLGGLGWYIPVTVKNEDYNPTTLLLEIVSQDADGHLQGGQTVIITTDGLSSRTAKLHLFASDPSMLKLAILYVQPAQPDTPIMSFLSQPADLPVAAGSLQKTASEALNSAAAAIANAYSAANGETALGTPQEFVRFWKGDVAFQVFVGADGKESAIIATKDSKGFVVAGAIWKKYRETETLGASLGNPVSAATESVSQFKTKGRTQQFSGGFITELLTGKQQGSTYAVVGPISEKWNQLGRKVSPLGFPVSNQSSAPISRVSHVSGDVQRFEGGSVFSYGQTFAVSGEIDAKYWDIGGPASWLGFPTSDAETDRGGRFEAGFASQTGMKTAEFFPPSPPKWIKEFAQGVASIEIDEATDTAYVFTGSTLVAMRAKTGEEIWRFDTSSSTDRPQWIVTADIVVVGHLANNSVAGLDRATGKVVWQQFVNAIDIRLAGSTAASGNVFALDFQQDNPRLWALDLKSGAVQWRYSVPGGIFLRVSKDAVFVSTGQSRPSGDATIGIIALAASNGTSLWGLFEYFSTAHSFWGLGLDDEFVYQFSDPRQDVSAYTHDGKLKWRYKAEGQLLGGEEKCGKNICVFTTSGIYSLQKATGLPEWHYTQARFSLSRGSTYASTSGSALWVTTFDEVLGLDTTTGRLIARVPTSFGANAAVASSKDTLYVGTGGYVAAFDIASLTQAKTSVPATTKENRKIIVIPAFLSSSTCSGDDRLVDKVRWLRKALPGYKDEAFFYFDYGGGYCKDNPNTPEDESKNPNYSAVFTCVNGVVRSSSMLNLMIAEILQKYPSAKIDIVGHSMGGLVAAYWAATHQDDQKLKSIHSVITFDSPLQGIEGWKANLLKAISDTPAVDCSADKTAITEMLDGSSVINTVLAQPITTAVSFVTIRAVGGGLVLSEKSLDDVVTDSKATLPGAWKDLYAPMGNHIQLWETPIPEAVNLVVSTVTTDPPH